MWLMTPIGFFSIVQKAADQTRGTLTVRARARGDLENLRRQYLPELGEIEESTHSDYRFRAVAPRAELSAALAQLVTTIDYNNFKSEVARQQGPVRAQAYQKVWEILYRLQAESGSPAATLSTPAPVTLTRKAYHPRKNDQGRPVLLSRPATPSSPATWNDPTQQACVIPQGWMPAQINGIPVSKWPAAPKPAPDWSVLAGDGVPDEPVPPAGAQSLQLGVVIQESDGRVWLVAPSNGMGGCQTAFPRGLQLDAATPAAAALQMCHQATGLQVRLLRHLVDVSGSHGPIRFYLAERVAGHPAEMGWMTQAVLLVPLIALPELLDHPDDRAAMEALIG